MRPRMWIVLLVSCGSLSAGCSGSGRTTSPPAAAPPAKVQNGGVKEADLATITLTPQAEQRLGLETAPASLGRVARRRTFAGEVVLPPSRLQTIASPVAGTLLPAGIAPAVGLRVEKGQVLFRILPLVAAQRDLRVTAENELTAAKTRLETARLRQARADQMLRDQVGSARAQEDARQELKQAEVAFEGTRARLERIEQAPLDSDVSLGVNAPAAGVLRQVFAAPGQKVASGAPLFELVDYTTMWLRVPVYAGEVGECDVRAAARIEPLGGNSGTARIATPVSAPPSADPASDTVDLYFELRDAEGVFRPGEKLNATLSLREGEESLQVPRASVLYDFRGGAWVYENTAPHVFARRRVEIRRVEGETVLLGRGLKPGSKVVTAGAAELFGTEFGAGK
jgi:membrane fusion protein, heavy metal efflux system